MESARQLPSAEFLPSSTSAAVAGSVSAGVASVGVLVTASVAFAGGCAGGLESEQATTRSNVAMTGAILSKDFC